MINFDFYSPTKIYFGKNRENEVGEIIKKYGYDVRITAIATNTKGNLVNPEGIRLEKALDETLFEEEKK